MTVINNIEIDIITYNRNLIKEAILNNDIIEDRLHVIIVISNPCLYARRYILMKEFINRMELEETNVIVYIVELAYGKQKFIITDSKNKRHLQLRTDTPLWHKENMINLGVKKLLPENWKAFAWIDSDIEFENVSWASDTLKVLNGSCDIVQLFSHCIDMNQVFDTMTIFSSFGYQYIKQRNYGHGLNYWHPGYGWAITRRAYYNIGGLYDKGILGSGDNIIALSILDSKVKPLNEASSRDYLDDVLQYKNKIKKLRLGYIPGVIRHHFHGSKKNRHYGDRWQILIKYDFQPSIHIQYNQDGLLVPTDLCPQGLLDEIVLYFKSRNEDEFYQDNNIIKKI